MLRSGCTGVKRTEKTEFVVNHRLPVRPALGLDAAPAEIEKNRGLLYDGEVVDVCLRLFRGKGFAFS